MFPEVLFNSVCGPGCLSRIPDPFSSIPDPGFWVAKIPNPEVFLTQKTATKFSKISCGVFIPVLDYFHTESRDQKSIGSGIRIRNTALDTLFTRILQ